MPLPNVKSGHSKQCSARTKRTGLPCKNPAAYGCGSCRLHGAKKPETIKRGKQHPNYVHGGRTLEAEAETSRKLREIRFLEEIGHAIGILSGNKMRGRKPRAN